MKINIQLFGGRGTGSRKYYLHYGQQGKHWKWHNNYQEGKSPVAVSPQRLRDLVQKYKGSGERRGVREIVDFKEVIGKWFNSENGKWEDTTWGTIHWKNDGGYHVVPARPK